MAGFALAPWLAAREDAAPATEAVSPPVAAEAAAKPEARPEDPELASARKEQDKLATLNKLAAERLTAETNAMRAEITRLKMERELLSETLALEAAKRQKALKEELAALEAEKEKFAQAAELAKTQAEKLGHELKVVQTESALEVTRLQNEIARIEAAERRGQYADSEPVYLEKPLRDDGTLVISDRRIPLNGPITEQTADFVTSRIQYWNNKDRKMPIFIVIDNSPGGSVMAGYRILKSMESSDAPVHVVVKSFAASMAAGITTLAVESYAYPNAVLLHHQISATTMGRFNLTQQREFYEESQRWWKRLATPIAEKMGLSTDEFIRRMYERSTSGDWSEFGEQARDLKWVNHIVQGIDESSITKDPDAKPRSVAPAAAPAAMVEEIDNEGRPFMWLPRLSPKDVYFLYNPDGYYRVR